MRTNSLDRLGLGLLLAAASGCAATATTVERTDPQAVVDLSGDWNDSDANQVAQAMIHDCLSRPWAERFRAEKGRLPVVRFHPIRNRTADYIDHRFFAKQLETALVDSGRVKVVADPDEALDARAERFDQAEWAHPATAKAHRRETGSDFILNGWILAQDDAVPGQAVRAYLTTMELIDSETNEKVWVGTHPIKKVVTRAAWAW